MARRTLGRILDSSPGRTLLSLLECIESRRPNLLRVLTYHRVADAEGFRQQMEFLQRHHPVVSPAEILEALDGGVPLPGRAILITFDDAYRNFADVAWPILKALGLRATLFVPTAYPGEPERVFWWERLEQAFGATERREAIETPMGRLAIDTIEDRRLAVGQLKRYLRTCPHSEALERTEEICEVLAAPTVPSSVLGWDELRRLSRQGVTLGAHTRTHPFLDALSFEEVRAETVGSREDLERECGATLPIFAYPNGRYGPETIEVLRETGFRLAFTTRRGTNDLEKLHPFEVRRINLSEDATASILRARLIHSSVHLNRWRHLFDPQMPIPREVGASHGH